MKRRILIPDVLALLVMLTGPAPFAQEEETSREAAASEETSGLREAAAPQETSGLREAAASEETSGLREAAASEETSGLREAAAPQETSGLREAAAPQETSGLREAAASEETSGTRKAAPRQTGGGLPLSLGAGLEANNNHRNGVALGIQAQADWRIFPFLAAGARGAFNSNFFFSNTVEAEGFVRFMLPLRALTVFAQAGGGVSWVFIYEGNAATPLFGGALGVRIPLGGFYLEPAVRLGVPFLWGAGLSLGKDFSKKRVRSNER
ncbi:MAG: hypothetical protein LBD86_01245 [Spirochaetaceae bacterium]|nr:hypothetical protein [Spirochaetaceae bacterium]